MPRRLADQEALRVARQCPADDAEEKADRNRGDSVPELVSRQLRCRRPREGDQDAGDVGRVLGDHRLRRRLLARADVGGKRQPGLARPAARLPERAGKRRPLGEEREPEHAVRDGVAALLRRSGEDPEEPLGDPEDAAREEDEDRGEQHPEEALLAVAERMLFVRSSLRPVEREEHQTLVARIRGRVRRLGEQRRRAAEESADALRRGDRRVRRDRHQHRLAALAALVGHVAAIRPGRATAKPPLVASPGSRAGGDRAGRLRTEEREHGWAMLILLLIIGLIVIAAIVLGFIIK